MHYLHLRMDEHAQKEIRDYANAIFDLVEPLVPITMEAFRDFRVNAMHLTGPEIEALANGTPIESPGERREFEEKLKTLKNKKIVGINKHNVLSNNLYYICCEHQAFQEVWQKDEEAHR
jgi:hypothetical protein